MNNNILKGIIVLLVFIIIIFGFYNLGKSNDDDTIKTDTTSIEQVKKSSVEKQEPLAEEDGEIIMNLSYSEENNTYTSSGVLEIKFFQVGASEIIINDKIIPTSGREKFVEKIELKLGTNQIKITGKNKSRSKEEIFNIERITADEFNIRENKKLEESKAVKEKKEKEERELKKINLSAYLKEVFENISRIETALRTGIELSKNSGDVVAYKIFSDMEKYAEGASIEINQNLYIPDIEEKEMLKAGLRDFTKYLSGIKRASNLTLKYLDSKKPSEASEARDSIESAEKDKANGIMKFVIVGEKYKISTKVV